MAMGPREGRVLHAMSIDDAYEVQRVLSSGSGGRTEVVTIDGFGPYLRKKIPSPWVRPMKRPMNLSLCATSCRATRSTRL